MTRFPRSLDVACPECGDVGLYRRGSEPRPDWGLPVSYECCSGHTCYVGADGTVQRVAQAAVRASREAQASVRDAFEDA